MMVHTTNLSSSYLSNLDPNFVGLGLGGRAWRPGLAATGVWYPAIPSIFSFIKQTWYVKIRAFRSDSNEVGFVIIL